MDCLIRFLPSERSVRVPAGTTLLEAAQRAGLPVARGCTGVGACARCAMRIVSVEGPIAEESPEETTAKQRNRIDRGLRLACQLALRGDLTVSASYW